MIDVKHYNVKVAVEPVRRQLSVEGEILLELHSEIGEFAFSLYDGFSIDSVSLDGCRVAAKPQDRSHFEGKGGRTRAWVLSQKLQPGPHRLTLAYSGSLGRLGTVTDTCHVDLVELSDYSGWIPSFNGSSPFTFELEVQVPRAAHEAFSDPVTVVSGRLTEQEITEDMIVTTWESVIADRETALLISPWFRATDLTLAGRDFGCVYSCLLSQAETTDLKGRLQGIYRFMSEHFGAPGIDAPVHIVLSPRFGWGFVRGNLLVCSELVYLTALRGGGHPLVDPFGDIVHEFIHFWWGKTVFEAETAPDGWVTEAVTQYLSAIALRQFSPNGQEFVNLIYDYWAQQVRSVKDPTPIVRTPAASPDMYALWYSKGVWVLKMLTGRIGEDRVMEILRRAYQASVGREVTTEDIKMAAAEVAGGLDQFWYQWLEREDLPELAVRWGPAPDKRRRPTIENGGPQDTVEVEVEFKGEPFELEIPLTIICNEGEVTRIVKTNGRLQAQSFEVPVPGEVLELKVDTSEVLAGEVAATLEMKG